MIELRRGAAGPFRDEPLTWRPVRMPGETWSAVVICREGHGLMINDHVIFDDGVVYPSVRCAQPDCHWLESVKLVGWNEGMEAIPARGRR